MMTLKELERKQITGAINSKHPNYICRFDFETNRVYFYSINQAGEIIIPVSPTVSSISYAEKEGWEPARPKLAKEFELPEGGNNE